MPSIIKYPLEECDGDGDMQRSGCSQLYSPQRLHLASIFLFAFNFLWIVRFRQFGIKIYNFIQRKLLFQFFKI